MIFKQKFCLFFFDVYLPPFAFLPIYILALKKRSFYRQLFGFHQQQSNPVFPVPSHPGPSAVAHTAPSSGEYLSQACAASGQPSRNGDVPLSAADILMSCCFTDDSSAV